MYSGPDLMSFLPCAMIEEEHLQEGTVFLLSVFYVHGRVDEALSARSMRCYNLNLAVHVQPSPFPPRERFADQLALQCLSGVRTRLIVSVA